MPKGTDYQDGASVICVRSTVRNVSHPKILEMQQGRQLLSGQCRRDTLIFHTWVGYQKCW